MAVLYALWSALEFGGRHVELLSAMFACTMIFLVLTWLAYEQRGDQ